MQNLTPEQAARHLNFIKKLWKDLPYDDTRFDNLFDRLFKIKHGREMP